MNINEEQNPAKLIKLRKQHLIVKQHFYKSFGIQCCLHLHFYLLWKERWRSWINVRDASFFVEREISLSNNATLKVNGKILKVSLNIKKCTNVCPLKNVQTLGHCAKFGTMGFFTLMKGSARNVCTFFNVQWHFQDFSIHFSCFYSVTHCFPTQL